MKLNITKEETFSMSINGVIHIGFVIESKWEGMVKYKSKYHTVIAIDGFNETPFSFVFHDKQDCAEHEVIMISPDLLAKE